MQRAAAVRNLRRVSKRETKILETKILDPNSDVRQSVHVHAVVSIVVIFFPMESVEFWPKVPAPRNRARAKVARA